MANQSSYSRSGMRPYPPSLASMNSGDQFGPRGMGPPPMDYPPQPVEIDLNSSRTLPSPSSLVANVWEPFQPHALGDISFGSTVQSRTSQNSGEIQARDPIQSWYAAHDGPWVPVMKDALPESLSHNKYTGNRIPMSVGGQYRQPGPSEAGSYHMGALHSDSGYETRRSVATMSIFSGEYPDRDQDCQSLVGHVADLQPFQNFGSVLPHQDMRVNGSWSSPTSNPAEPSRLFCPTCNNSVKTPSELKKHELRHTKPFICEVPGCPRTEGFSTKNDLDRHTNSKHPSAMSEKVPVKKFRCLVPGCTSKNKIWPRLDNFRNHLKRMHDSLLQKQEDFEDMARRGDFTEKGCPADPELSQRYNLPEPSQAGAHGPSKTALPTDLARLARTSSYPEVVEPNPPRSHQGYSLPQPSRGTTTQRSPLPEEPLQRTVQPLDVYPLGRAPERSARLDKVISAPAGPDLPSNTPTSDSKPATRIDTGETTRQTPPEDSASDSALTEVIKTVLAESADTLKSDLRNVAMHRDASGRSRLPNSKLTTSKTWPQERPEPTPSTGDQEINKLKRSLTEPESKDLPDKDKVLEVFKVLETLGYTLVQKDRPASPPRTNAGSVASNKSEKQVICQKCHKFRGRPCELNKHMKRHAKPYGCTFQTCHKTFGSKNDWKRHENSQHFHQETWRCSLPLPHSLSSPCAKVCYRKQTFYTHLRKDHRITSEADIAAKIEQCRIGRSCQVRFWCGFCEKLVDLKKRGVDAWTERFDHIDNHFMGRNTADSNKKWDITEWVEVEGNKPKGLDADLETFNTSTSTPSTSFSSSSPENESDSPRGGDSGGESRANPINLDNDGPSRKRKARDSSNNTNSSSSRNANASTRPTKRARAEVTIYCCECQMPHNPRVDTSCTNCDGEHIFCSECRREEIHVESVSK